jgi:hydroxylamine reductase (hybrid-cluster protein)
MPTFKPHRKLRCRKKNSLISRSQHSQNPSSTKEISHSVRESMLRQRSSNIMEQDNLVKKKTKNKRTDHKEFEMQLFP